MHQDSDDSTKLENVKKVDEAIQNIQAGNISNAQHLLEEVIANTPDDYLAEYEKDGVLHIEFWDKLEFLHYVTWQKLYGTDRSVTWVLNAYPRAYYYLGFTHVHLKNYYKALEYLDIGHRLQPNNPTFLMEKATAYSSLGEHSKALSLYEQVPDIGPFTTAPMKARALRGEGSQLIELGQLDAAEKAYKRSLKHDPDNELALQEIAYISHLRSGGRRTTARLVKTESLQKGKKRSKRWWQFWK
jgi:tetratricopeptide (TPR) repeat protein